MKREVNCANSPALSLSLPLSFLLAAAPGFEPASLAAPSFELFFAFLLLCVHVAASTASLKFNNSPCKFPNALFRREFEVTFFLLKICVFA
jgi:hypothetical protein